jgi:hypothetical protein
MHLGFFEAGTFPPLILSPASAIQATPIPRQRQCRFLFSGFLELASNFLLHYGVRYDVELMNRRNASTPLLREAERILDVAQSIPKDTNNIAPRLGFSGIHLKAERPSCAGLMESTTNIH